MSFCKVGEKAYLRVNDSEVWKFDGPVSYVIENKEILEAGKSLRITLAANQLAPHWRWKNPHWYWNDLVMHINGEAPLTYTVNRTFLKNNTGYGPQYVFRVTALQRNGTYAVNDYGTPINNLPGGLEWWDASDPWEAGRWWQNGEPQVIGYEKQLIITFGPSSQRLIKTLDPSDDPKITVTCRDRCPPGTTWSERCKACVCDDMGAIKAGLKGATAIARSIGRDR